MKIGFVLVKAIVDPKQSEEPRENLAKKYNLNENDIDIIKNYIQLS